MAHRRRRLERRGRPRKSDARRRATTLAERRAPDDLGSPELRIRKLKAANSSEVPVELADVAGILRANDLISDDELVTLRLVAGWLRQLQRVLHLSRASPGGLWVAITSGARGGGWAPLNPGGGDAALFRLSQLHAYFTELDQLPRLSLVMGVAVAEARPTTRAELLGLRAGLQIIASLQKHGRRSAPPAAVETASPA